MDFLNELLFPATDRAVYIQWGVALGLWLAVLAVSWRAPREVKTFLFGLFMVNVAFFALNAAH